MNANEIKAAQDNGKIVCVVDIARRFDVASAKAAGVNVERLLVSQPDSVEQAREIAESVVRSGAIDIVVVIGALGRWSLALLRDLAARSGTEIQIVDAEPLPAPKPTAAEVERQVIALIRKVDRKLRADSLATAMDRLGARVEAVNAFEATRPAHYALAWAIDTGRFSSEMEGATRGRAPTAFARAALKIAHDLGGHAVREIYEAWRDIALAHCKAAA